MCVIKTGTRVEATGTQKEKSPKADMEVKRRKKNINMISKGTNQTDEDRRRWKSAVEALYASRGIKRVKSSKLTAKSF